MSNFEQEVVITDGLRQYFRPSMYKMEKDVKDEVTNFKDEKISKNTLLQSYESLVIVDQPYDRLCFIRKKLNDYNIKSSNENYTDLMVLLGLEHKITTQLNDCMDFCKYYAELIDNIDEKLANFKYRMYRLFKIHSKSMMPLLHSRKSHEMKLFKFEKEQEQLKTMLTYIKGKILYLSDENISKLGIIKE